MAQVRFKSAVENSSLVITRNDISLELVSVQMERGTKGWYLGLKSPLDLTSFETFSQSMTPAVLDEEGKEVTPAVLKENSFEFNSWLVSQLNLVVFQPAWKSAVEGISPDAVLTPAQEETVKEKFSAAVLDFFNPESKRTVVKNSSWYSKQVGILLGEAKKLKAANKLEEAKAKAQEAREAKLEADRLAQVEADAAIAELNEFTV